MTNWQEIIEETGIKIGLFIAGCVGAIVSFLKPKKLTLPERILTVLAGGFTAMYVTPVAVGLIKIGDSGSFFLAYCIGYMGLKSIELAITELKKRFSKK